MSDDPGTLQQPEAPERATPSAWAYRGALGALVIGSFLALFLVLRPPESNTLAESVRPAVEATEVAAPPTETTPTPVPTSMPAQAPTQAPSQTPTQSPTQTPPTPASTPAATPEPTPIQTATPEPTPPPTPPTSNYRIVEGDTLSDIAETYGVTLESILDLNPDLDADTIQIGQIIQVPRP